MEFDPLFEPGIHNIKMSEFHTYFVESFNPGNRRKYLVERFYALLERFNEVGINAEIWIDGSFCTKKEEPGDIDVIFFYDPIQVNSLLPEKQRILIELFNNPVESKLRYGCDLFFVPNNNLNQRSYWRGWFGFSREERPKGIARVFIN